MDERPSTHWPPPSLLVLLTALALLMLAGAALPVGPQSAAAHPVATAEPGAITEAPLPPRLRPRIVDPLRALHQAQARPLAEQSVAAILAQPPQSEFQRVTLTTNTAEPIELAVLPDLSVLFIERGGAVKIWKSATASVVSAGTLAVFTGNEDGLLGVTLDPNFATNRWVYLYYSPSSSSVNRLSRFTLNGDTLDMASERIMLNIPTQRNRCCHTGGSLDFGPDGNLYLSTGDNTYSREDGQFSGIDERPGREDWDAQRSSGNTNDLRGKLLRIRPQSDGTYTIPAGNLFAASATTRPEIYSMGHRNTYRINVDSETGWVYIGEVGPDATADSPTRGPRAYDEINQVRGSGNYGWPYCQANNKPYFDYDFATGTTGPPFNCAALVNNSPNNTGNQNLPPSKSAWIWYPKGTATDFPGIGTGSSSAATGVAVYHYDPALSSSRKFPAYYDDRVFIMDFQRNWIKSVQLDGAGGVGLIEDFLPGTVFSNPIEMEFGPDGALYVIEYAGFFGGSTNTKIARIDYVGVGGSAPVAQATATPDAGSAPLAVQFKGDTSYDPDGGPITYAWDFTSNGSVDSTVSNPSFTYSAAGNYTARLTVTKSTGKTGVIDLLITAGNNRPVVTISDPPEGGLFEWGEDVHFTVGATDTEDGSTPTGIGCASLSTLPALGHDEHKHDDLPLAGCQGDVSIAANTEGDTDNLFYILDSSYTDRGAGSAGALTGRTRRIIQPKQKQAEYYTTMNGVDRETTGDTAGGNQNLSAIHHGDWTAYAPLNLRNISSISYRVASAGLGGRIEVHVDSPTGALISTANIPVTGAWQTYTDVTAPITDPGGTHTLYFVFLRNAGDTGALFNVNWIRFVGAGVSAPGLPNLALNKAATADSSCAATEGPAKAVNGSVAGGDADKWCSLGATKWLEVDLGSAASVSKFIVKHAGAGGENSAWNTRDFNIQVRTSTSGAWTTVVNVTGNTASQTIHTITAAQARYVRLNITAPTSTGDTAARIYEFEVYGSTTTTPTPTATRTATPPPSATNLALNKAATADSSCAAAEGPAKAVNGSVSGGNTDKWCSLGATKWLEVDLGAAVSVSSFIVKHAGAGGENTAWNTRDFNIQVRTSTSGAWTTVVNVTGNTANQTTHNITAVQARYVRLNVTVPTSNGNSAARIYEFEVYGGTPPTPTPTATRTATPTPTPPPSTTNLALNKAATADSSCAATEGPAKAVNGSVAGGDADKWCSLGATKWLEVDLGAAVSVSSFVVKHAGAGGENSAWNTRDFNIQVRTSTSGAWTTVVNVTGNTANQTTHNITAVQARYVRLNITAPTSTSDTAARIYEFEVYGGTAPTPTPTPTPAPTATPVPPPAGATILFNGSSFNGWGTESNNGPVIWRLVEGNAMEVFGNSYNSCCANAIVTTQKFTDFRLHIEFWLPRYGPQVVGQERANSGIYLQQRYELQVLDSFGVSPLGNGDAASIYQKRAPDSNAARPPETWQTYDVTFRAARFDAQGNKTANARVTVVWNGTTVHNDIEIDGPTGNGLAESAAPGGIRLQDHGHPVRYRNIWIEPLP